MINNIYGKFCTKEIDHEGKIYDEDEIADKYPDEILKEDYNSHYNYWTFLLCLQS